jgi:hypothetical protein
MNKGFIVLGTKYAGFEVKEIIKTILEKSEILVRNKPL